jgi:hypothetical protein
VPTAEIKDLTGVISVVVTAFATLAAVFITNLHNARLAKLNIDSNERRDLVNLRISRIEDFYLLFEKWQAHVGGVYLHHYRCYLGKLTFPQVQELAKDRDMLAPGEFQRLTMLMRIHFPVLAADYDLVDKAKRRVAPYLVDPKSTKLTAENLSSELDSFEDACDTFKAKISAHAQLLIDR